MSLPRKRTHNADTIAISSSSDTSEASEASEDSIPEYDVDSPSKQSEYAAGNGMSERQTRKVNSGSFGMFNRLTLMPKTPLRTQNAGKKRKRVKEYSAYQEKPQTARGTKQRGRVNSGVIELDSENEEESSLFVPKNTPQARPIVIDESEDEQYLYIGMTPERARKAKEYISALRLVDTADERLRIAEEELSAATTEHTNLLWKLATIDSVAENNVSDIIQQRDEAIRIANEHAQEKIKHVREQLPAKKESYEEKLQKFDKQMRAAEECIAEVKAELGDAKERKVRLEHQGGFDLCSDVREVQARAQGNRKKR